ncbi:MAG: glycosyltransferase [Salibacteraceae bacterium]
MAVKNTASYLPKCLQSIRQQGYDHWELIAVDDHSTDKSRDVLESFARSDHRIKVVDNEGEKLIPALKTGIKYAQGELVNRMDSDDYMPHDKIETLVNEWQKYGMGYVIAGGTKHFSDEGELGAGFERYDRWLNHVAQNGLYREELYRECVIPSHCWLMHRADFDRIGGFEPEVYPEDYDLCFRMVLHGLTIVGIDKVLHYWRDRKDRISRTWDCYKDNRYYQLKTEYFCKIDRDPGRPLVLWGAGRNGKDLAKELIRLGLCFKWVCENSKKIGHNIYGVTLNDSSVISHCDEPQILVAVASPADQETVDQKLASRGMKRGYHYWFF